MKTWVIDGYNVMNASDRLREMLGSQEADRARTEFLDALALFASRRKASVIVVFDGAVPPGIGSARVKVISSRTRSADDVIREEARRHGRELMVVSSDSEIVDTARACLAGAVSADAFLSELGLPRTAPPSGRRSAGGDPDLRPHRIDELRETSEKPGSVDDDDLDEWRRLFGV